MCIGSQCYTLAIINDPLLYVGTFLALVGLTLLLRRNKPKD